MATAAPTPAPVASTALAEPVVTITEAARAPEQPAVEQSKPLLLAEEEIAATAPAIVAIEPEVVVPAAIATEPLVDLEKALETSGLVMVETSGDKVKAWQPEETRSVAAPRRKRHVAVATPDEPLVMVETNK